MPAATKVFFRDDDVTALTAPFERVADLLVRESVPCNYAVVPERLTPDAAKLLRELRQQHPNLVRLNQHGCRHARTRPDGTEAADEFGGRRPYADQLKALQRGRRLLEDALADQFDARVFTPPCHKYDENTLTALEALDFEVLSASVHVSAARRGFTRVAQALQRSTWLGHRVSYHGRTIVGTALRELSVAIDVDEDLDRHGRKRVKTADELWREFEAARRRESIVGVMLHHPTYLQPEKLAPLAEFVRALRAEADVDLICIESLADRLAPAVAVVPSLSAESRLA